jgi:hypothetical protein
MNIFTVKNSGGSAVTCKIINRLGDTLFVVKDRKGRKFNAESNGTYKVGEYVVVKSGIIVGKSTKARTVTHYNV